MKKQMEGDNQQRRAAAADAREEGRSASEDGASTGASKQRRKADKDAGHEERLGSRAHGKQQPERFTGQPRPGSTPSRRGAGETTADPTDQLPPRDGRHATPGDLDEHDERVFRTLAELETADSAPTLGEIARRADLEIDLTTEAVQRLVGDHDLVQELPADPTEGHRYRVKARS